MSEWFSVFTCTYLDMKLMENMWLANSADVNPICYRTNETLNIKAIENSTSWSSKTNQLNWLLFTPQVRHHMTQWSDKLTNPPARKRNVSMAIEIQQKHLLKAASEMVPSVPPSERAKYKMMWVGGLGAWRGSNSYITLARWGTVMCYEGCLSSIVLNLYCLIVFFSSQMQALIL